MLYDMFVVTPALVLTLLRSNIAAALDTISSDRHRDAAPSAYDSPMQPYCS